MEETKYDPFFGAPIHSWTFKAYEKDVRDKKWYITASVIGLALLVYALAAQNFTFAFLIILFAIVYFLFEIHEPNDVTFEITDVGIRFGRSFHPYKEVEKFWILYIPPHTKNLYVKTKSVANRVMTIPLHSINPVEVRETLLHFVKEDLEENEIPLSESIGKLLKL